MDALVRCFQRMKLPGSLTTLSILSYRIRKDESLMYVDVMLTEPKGFGVAPEPHIR